MTAAETDERTEQGMSVLKEMIDLLGLSAEIARKDGPDGAILSVKTSDPGRLIGRKGHYLESLELVLNRIMRKRFDKGTWLEIDIDGYQKNSRRRRGSRQESGADEERLQKIATDAAKEVKRWGRDRKIGPFSARDRRIVHVTLRDDEEIVTESEEQGDSREGMKAVTVRLAQKTATSAS